MKMKSTLLFAGLMLSLSSIAWAAPPKGPGGEGQRMGPPQEAIDACIGKTEGESVSFTTPRGNTVNGTCQLKEDTLVAVPENAPQGGQQRPAH